jgi:uncharacterized delta-60 repeat protein
MFTVRASAQTTDLSDTGIRGRESSLTVNALLDPPGTLDVTFDTDGKVTADFSGNFDIGYSIVVQADDKIIAIGGGNNGTNSDFALIRYNSDGSPDTSFDSDGKVMTDFAADPLSSGSDTATSGAILPDGRILAAGYTSDPTGYSFALARYNPDGSLDTTFDIDGKVITSFDSTYVISDDDDLAASVVVQPDGKILAGGVKAGSVSFFALARYNGDGSLDTAFGDGGKVVTDFNGSGVEGGELVLQPDGKILLAGSSRRFNNLDFDFALARYNSDGSLDAVFRNGGKVTTDFGLSNDHGRSITLQPDGKILVAGGTDGEGQGFLYFALARYNSDGSLDTTFDTDGKLVSEIADDFVEGMAVAIQPSGRIIVGGYTADGINDSDFALERRSTDGSLDPSFGTGGRVITDFGSMQDSAVSLTIQRDGKILAAGNTGAIAGNYDFALARYLGNATHYVKWDASGANNGASWADAYADLQSALAAASEGDEIWVAAGTYKPTTGTDRTISFTLKDGVAVYGGFAGTETSRTQRDLETNITVLSGDIGIADDNSDNSYHVVVGSNAGGSAILDGFIITAGNASGESPRSHGGGMFNDSGNPTLANLTFSNNAAAGLGGGMYNNFSSPTLTNITFSGNTAGLGGGMENETSSSPNLTNVTFSGNSAESGGGILNRAADSSPILTHVTFSNNSASSEGGAIANAGSPIIRNSILWGNTGGEIFNTSWATPDVTYSIVQGGYSGTGNLAADPLLGPLQDNGGFTQTLALGVGSPAIDAGAVASCPATDQRGVARPQESGCDLGAYELEAGSMLPGETVLVSVDSSSGPSNQESFDPSMSADGRYVAFESLAADLVPGDTNAVYDIFVRDMQTNVTSRVSLDSAGAQANGESARPSISADGRYLAFLSLASNLVPGDSDGWADIFVHDMQTGLTAIVSVDSTGAQANGSSYFPDISADGRHVVFYSHATNLVPGDTNAIGDIFVHDMQTGMTTIVSVDSNGVQGNGDPITAAISANGRYIAFESGSTNLVPGDTNGENDIFLRDMQTGTTTRVSVDSSGVQANSYSHDPAISADGRYVTFFSQAANLVSGDTNAVWDIFVRDTQMGTTRRVSVDSNGVQGNDDSAIAVLSADGRYIAFRSEATNLVPGDTNGKVDVFLFDTQTGMTTRVSVDSNGAQANNTSDAASLSADGSQIAFASDATNLVPGDTNSTRDIFLHRRGPASTDPTNTPTYTPTDTPTLTATPPYSYNPLYLSLTSSQTIGGVSSADEDILRFDGANWSLFFDGSDVGVGSPDLFAFSILDADTILMSFGTNVTVNGIAATPQDVLRFDSTSLGSTTAGTWSLYFDGSDVGLDSTTNEKIDSLSRLPDGRLLISTNGNPSVPGLTGGKDEDMLAFTSASLGDVTSGTWSLYFDGSDVGLSETSGEDVDAFDIAGENIFLSTQGDFSVNGLIGADEDVFVCAAGSVGEITACDYSSSLYFDGSTWGLSANGVDAFQFHPSGPTPPTAVPTDTPTPTPTHTPTATATPSPTATGNIFTFVPLADAYVNAGSPTANYGASTTLRADASPDLHSYLRFDVQGLSGAVTKATLRVYANSPSSLGCIASRVDDNTWTEATINYNNAPAVGSALGSSGAFGGAEWITIDVTAYLTGNGSYNLALTTSSGTAISFASSEAGANAPQLIVETAP